MMDPVSSPDGTLRVEYQANEARMSHWIFNPRVTAIATGEVLFDLWPSQYWDWSTADTRFESDGTLTLVVCRYPDGATVHTIAIDPLARTWRSPAPCPAELRSALSEHLREA